VCITTNQPDTESNPNHNHNQTTKQLAIVNIQLDIVTCHTYPEKFRRDEIGLLYCFTTFRFHCHSIAHCRQRLCILAMHDAILNFYYYNIRPGVNP